MNFVPSFSSLWRAFRHTVIPFSLASLSAVTYGQAETTRYFDTISHNASNFPPSIYIEFKKPDGTVRRLLDANASHWLICGDGVAVLSQTAAGGELVMQFAYSSVKIRESAYATPRYCSPNGKYLIFDFYEGCIRIEDCDIEMDQWRYFSSAIWNAHLNAFIVLPFQINSAKWINEQIVHVGVLRDSNDVNELIPLLWGDIRIIPKVIRNPKPHSNNIIGCPGYPRNEFWILDCSNQITILTRSK